MIMVWKQQLFPIQRKKRTTRTVPGNIYEPCVGGDLRNKLLKQQRDYTEQNNIHKDVLIVLLFYFHKIIFLLCRIAEKKTGEEKPQREQLNVNGRA